MHGILFALFCLWGWQGQLFYSLWCNFDGSRTGRNHRAQPEDHRRCMGRPFDKATLQATPSASRVSGLIGTSPSSLTHGHLQASSFTLQFPGLGGMLPKLRRQSCLGGVQGGVCMRAAVNGCGAPPSFCWNTGCENFCGTAGQGKGASKSTTTTPQGAFET